MYNWRKIMRTIQIKKIALLLTAGAMLTAAGCTSGDDSSAGKTSSAAESTSQDTESAAETTSSGGFKVDGTKLLDANGNEFIMRGINHPHSWYADLDGTAFPAIAGTGANCIRIVCSDGGQYSKDSLETLEKLIQLSIDNDMIAVLEVHDATGSDNVSDISAAADYWLEMKDALIGNEQYVILNIANEWVGSWNADVWEEGYTTAIPKLREAGIKNTIMVDSAGWGQFGDCIAQSGKAVFDSDPEGNTMFSVHMYGTAGKNAETIEKNLTNATNQGLCVCVGEFGYTHSDGDVDEAYIMEYCEKNGIGYMGWSWKGNSGGVEYLDIANEWDGSVLSPDWGEVLVNGENGIKKTAKKCSVFE